MQKKSTRWVLVSKPGILRNALHSYLNSQLGNEVACEVCEVEEFLNEPGMLSVDLAIINEEGREAKTEAVLQAIRSCRPDLRYILIVGDSNRQRALGQMVGGQVLVRGFLDKDLNEALFSNEASCSPETS